jgi:hypothetical protein
VDVERELRTALTADRLSLPIRPDAVALLEAGVRRRRRSRTVVTVSAAVVLLAGGATAVSLGAGDRGGPERVVGPAESPTPTPTPTPATKPSLPAPTLDEVPWASDAYDYHHPPAFPGAVADPSVPWCRASQLTLSQTFQGATGDWAGPVVVVNSSPQTCALQGQPALRMQAADGRTLVASTPEPFYVDEWIRLAPGHSAGAFVDWMQEFCHEPPASRLVVSLPHDAGTLSTGMSGTPRCNSQTDPPSAGRLDVEGFRSTADRPFTPLAGLEARIDNADVAVAPGATLDYQLHLASMDAPSVALNPCLPYRERLVDHVTRRVLVEEDHLLNCGAAPARITDPQSMHDTVFDLELVVPADAPAGGYDLLWQSVLKPVAAVDEQLVKVTQPVPACRDGQVSASAGNRGAAGGSYYDVIVFRNISTTTCSLFGYPGVALTDASGQAVTTDLQHGPPGNGRLVVLAPGASASTTISGGDSGPNGGATACRPTAGVRVIAPGQHRQTLVRGSGMRCYDTVTVWPVVAGTRGSIGG